MTDLTFAYGMNMYPDTMHPQATGQAAWLPGYRLCWRGYADVEPEQDGIVPGVLWTLPAGELARLDFREGYPHLYGRWLLPVATRYGTEEAWVYRMTARTAEFYVGREGLATCSDGYLDTVARGRRAFGHADDDLLHTL